jgi:pyruvate dehydrogenase E2 component (dihydrolipoamide acetyltransferase)
MATPVEVPKLGNTVEECLIAKWRKQKGERVSAGEILVEIETDKATFEVTAPVDGALLETFFGEGALVPVYTNLCVIGEPGEEVEAFRPGKAAPASSDAVQSRAQGAPLEGAIEPGSTAQIIGQAQATPTTPGGSPAAGLEARPTFSPRARQFAEEHDFHPAAVAGSGPGGRVLEEDLRQLYFSSPRPTAAARKRMEDGAEARGEGSGIAGSILAADLGPAPVRVSGIREKIARRMRESLASTAQYTMHASADAGGLLRLRARAKASANPAVNIGDMTAFCVILALREFPDVNAEFIDGRIYRHSVIHLGFACDTPRGLVVPVVKDAQQLGIAELSRRMKELAAQAVGGSIAVDDLSGATFTVSNLGSLGIESFTPLLNPPQVAILGIDAIQVKPVRRNGAVEFIDSIGLSLTCDHQVVDGAPGARFLAAVREKIEKVESLCTI